MSRDALRDRNYDTRPPGSDTDDVPAGLPDDGEDSAAAPGYGGESAVPASPTLPPTPGPEKPDKLVGTKLGKYIVVRLLGKGGMGAVYEARDELIERPVAIKVLPDALAEDEDTLRRFLMEARSAGRLNHPNAVAVFDVDQVGRTYFIVMELVKGTSAQEFIKARGRMNWPEAARVVADACRALVAAHEAGLIHRDIKPANIMRAVDGTVKIADFGLAKNLASGQDTGVTRAGSVMGTPLYMSPEQCQCEVLDARSDIYSLGACFHALLTGKPPYGGDGVAVPQIMFSHCYGALPDPRTSDPELPEACSHIVQTAMAKRKEDRYPTARAMLDDIERLIKTPAAARGGTSAWDELVRAAGNLGVASRTGANTRMAPAYRSGVRSGPGSTMAMSGVRAGSTGATDPVSADEASGGHDGIEPAPAPAVIRRTGGAPGWVLPVGLTLAAGVLILGAVLVLTAGKKDPGDTGKGGPSRKDPTKNTTSADDTTHVPPDTADPAPPDPGHGTPVVAPKTNPVAAEYQRLNGDLKRANTDGRLRDLSRAVDALRAFARRYSGDADPDNRGFAKIAGEDADRGAAGLPDVSLALRPGPVLAPAGGGGITAMTVAPSRGGLAWIAPDFKLRIRPLAPSGAVATSQATVPFAVQSLSPVGTDQWAIGGGEGEPVQGFHSDSGATTLRGGRRNPHRAALSSDGRLLVTVDAAGQVSVTPVGQGSADPKAPAVKPPDAPRAPSLVALAANGVVAVAGESGAPVLLDGRDGRQDVVRLPLEVPVGTAVPKVTALAFSADSATLAVAFGDRIVRCWDVETGRLRTEVGGNDSAPTALAFTPDGRRLVVAEADGRIRIWELLVVVWSDDFESYTAGAWPPPPPDSDWNRTLAAINTNMFNGPPPPGVWFPDGAAMAMGAEWSRPNAVDVRTAFGGRQSLCVYGATNHLFTAWALRLIGTAPPWFLEARVAVSDEPTGAGHARAVHLGIRHGLFWRNDSGKHRNLATGIYFGPNRWGKVLIGYDLVGDMVEVTVWYNDVLQSRHVYEAVPWESRPEILLMLHSNAASAWFDDMRVLRPPPDDPGTRQTVRAAWNDVLRRLAEANPGMGRPVDLVVREDRLVAITIPAGKVRDVSMLAELTDLRGLTFRSQPAAPAGFDLKPLQSVPLTWLRTPGCEGLDLTPLREHPTLLQINGRPAAEATRR